MDHQSSDSVLTKPSSLQVEEAERVRIKGFWTYFKLWSILSLLVFVFIGATYNLSGNWFWVCWVFIALLYVSIGHVVRMTILIVLLTVILAIVWRSNWHWAAIPLSIAYGLAMGWSHWSLAIKPALRVLQGKPPSSILKF